MCKYSYHTILFTDAFSSPLILIFVSTLCFILVSGASGRVILDCRMYILSTSMSDDAGEDNDTTNISYFDRVVLEAGMVHLLMSKVTYQLNPGKKEALTHPMMDLLIV